MPAASANDSSASPATDRGDHNRLTLYIVMAIVAAIVLALAFPRLAMYFELGGQVFLRLLQMVVVPLVMASVMSGILGLGDIRKLGRPGGAALLFYLTTTLLAVFVGLIVVNAIDPGIGIDPELVQDARREGEREIDEATQRLRDQLDAVTWDSGTSTELDTNGLSDPLEIVGDSRPYLQITIVQKGVATQAASAEVRISPDGEQFESLPWDKQEGEDRFTAGNEPGSYSGKVHLPREAKFVRVDFTTQTGGKSSAISAHLLPGPPSIAQVLADLVLMLFTDNLLRSMVEVNLLPLIVFSIVFAAMLTTMGQRSELIAGLVTGINDALMSFIMLLMKVAPLGIFCLVTARFGKAQADGKFFELLQAQFYYIMTVLIGLAIHALITLPVILYVFTRRNPYRFIGQMSQALLTAFSTASSTATLPITMECAEQEAGVSKRSVEFVMPLGATVNMDGTALYEAAAAIFIAQAISFDLTTVGQLTIALTATLAAIGAAGIPEAGLVTMLIVLNAVGLPLELIGLILPVDWLLDRFRTAVNVFGDSVGTAVVEGTFPD